MANSNNNFMIVLELAKLGAFGNYLRSHTDMKLVKIIKILYQISSAMEYLHNIHIVHRDLAARNVLLASDELGKISDFGMSKKLKLSDKNESFYYYSRKQEKWYYNAKR